MISKTEIGNCTILKVESSPNIRLENMLGGADYLLSDNVITDEVRIIENATKSKVLFEIKDVETILNKMEEVSKKFKKIKHAVIIDSAVNTAFAYFIAESEKVPNNYIINVFSNKKNAEKWLEL